MVYKKTWARDFRFRSKLSQIELPTRFKRIFLMYLKEKKQNTSYYFLRRKMNRYGVAIPTRRCVLTGRSRGVIRDFHISRHKFKQLVEQGVFPGITKSSW